jgi:protein subunit release factor A
VFEEIVHEFDELESLISAVEIMSDVKLYNFYLKKHKQLSAVAVPLKKYKSLENDIQDFRLMLEAETDEVQRKVILDSIADAEKEKELALLMYDLMQKNSCFGFEAANHYYFNKGMLIEKMLSCTQMEIELSK